MSVSIKDVRKDQRYQVDIRIPNASGDLAPAVPGALTGITCRLSATRYGPAINAAVDNLPAAETVGVASRFYVDVDTALQVTHLLPLGVGVSYFAIWKKTGDMDSQSIEFQVGDGTTVS